MSGNAIVVKTSESVAFSSSTFSKAIQSCLQACGHDPNTVQILIGCEADSARVLTRNNENVIKHLTFIGSDKIGKEIAKDAAESLLPVTLELGGKVSILPYTILRPFAPSGEGPQAVEESAFSDVQNAMLNDPQYTSQDPNILLESADVKFFQDVFLKAVLWVFFHIFIQ